MIEIARIYTDFPDKFGIPRQSGLVKELKGEIVFAKEYASPEAVRGLEEYSHIEIKEKIQQIEKYIFCGKI